MRRVLDFSFSLFWIPFWLGLVKVGLILFRFRFLLLVFWDVAWLGSIPWVPPNYQVVLLLLIVNCLLYRATDTGTSVYTITVCTNNNLYTIYLQSIYYP